MPCGMEYPFGNLGSPAKVVSPPIFLCTPSLLADQTVWKTEDTLCAWALLRNNQTIHVLSTLCSSQIQNIAPQELLWRKLTLFKPKAGHCCSIQRRQVPRVLQTFHFQLNTRSFVHFSKKKPHIGVWQAFCLSPVMNYFSLFPLCWKYSEAVTIFFGEAFHTEISIRQLMDKINTWAQRTFNFHVLCFKFNTFQEFWQILLAYNFILPQHLCYKGVTLCFYSF